MAGGPVTNPLTDGRFKHGLSKSTTYKSWSCMWDRCTNPNSKDYPNYGGRGIKVCSRWKSFVNFHSDLGVKPLGFTLERINGSKGYNPSNCKWIPKAEQSRNKRDNFHVTFRGKRQIFAAWVQELGLDYHVVYNRHLKGKRGEALFAPITKRPRSTK